MEGRPPDPLSRYQALQVASILLILLGIVALAAALAVDAALLTGGSLPADRADLLPLLLVLAAGALALVIGLVMNAVRAVIVREALPAERYRGPSIIVLVMLASLMTGIASISLGAELSGLLGSGEVTVGGSLLLLTATQLGLLATAGLFVATPRALVGARFLPRHGLLRSVAIGIAIGIPAWLGAQLLSVVVTSLLSGIGVQPDPGLAEAALDRAEPWVLVVALVIVAPVAEEIFFRGIAFNAWEREYGTSRAVYGTAALFAVIHGSVFALAPIFALGLILALLYRRTRSLPATIALHATFNAISVAITLLVRFDILQLPVPT
jgi:membrane protease YdiL (CAAX protease family)